MSTAVWGGYLCFLRDAAPPPSSGQGRCVSAPGDGAKRPPPPPPQVVHCFDDEGVLRRSVGWAAAEKQERLQGIAGCGKRLVGYSAKGAVHSFTKQTRRTGGDSKASWRPLQVTLSHASDGAPDPDTAGFRLENAAMCGLLGEKSTFLLQGGSAVHSRSKQPSGNHDLYSVNTDTGLCTREECQGTPPQLAGHAMVDTAQGVVAGGGVLPARGGAENNDFWLFARGGDAWACRKLASDLPFHALSFQAAPGGVSDDGEPAGSDCAGAAESPLTIVCYDASQKLHRTRLTGDGFAAWAGSPCPPLAALAAAPADRGGSVCFALSNTLSLLAYDLASREWTVCKRARGGGGGGGRGGGGDNDEEADELQRTGKTFLSEKTAATRGTRAQTPMDRDLSDLLDSAGAGAASCEAETVAVAEEETRPFVLDEAGRLVGGAHTQLTPEVTCRPATGRSAARDRGRKVSVLQLDIAKLKQQQQQQQQQQAILTRGSVLGNGSQHGTPRATVGTPTFLRQSSRSSAHPDGVVVRPLAKTPSETSDMAGPRLRSSLRRAPPLLPAVHSPRSSCSTVDSLYCDAVASPVNRSTSSGGRSPGGLTPLPLKGVLRRTPRCSILPTNVLDQPDGKLAQHPYNRRTSAEICQELEVDMVESMCGSEHDTPRLNASRPATPALSICSKVSTPRMRERSMRKPSFLDAHDDERTRNPSLTSLARKRMSLPAVVLFDRESDAPAEEMGRRRQSAETGTVASYGGGCGAAGDVAATSEELAFERALWRYEELKSSQMLPYQHMSLQEHAALLLQPPEDGTSLRVRALPVPLPAPFCADFSLAKLNVGSFSPRHIPRTCAGSAQNWAAPAHSEWARKMPAITAPNAR
ncbi:hypothetical protein DIPPA_14454 [Diplonema papillatum]|nr:hypothetical protein DIPPA_14454 [Diplonema papillatum]